MTTCPDCQDSCVVLVRLDPEDAETWLEDVCKRCMCEVYEEEIAEASR